MPAMIAIARINFRLLSTRIVAIADTAIIAIVDLFIQLSRSFFV